MPEQRFERAEPQARETPARQAPPPGIRQTVEQQATAAVAAAMQTTTRHEDVTIRPMAPKPSLFMEPAMQEPAPQEMPKATFIPPAPERPAAPVRQPRMPRIDELPIPAQNQLRAQRGELQEDNPAKRRLTLLERLATGLGRREQPAEPETGAQMPEPQPPLLRPQPQRAAESRPEPVSEYAKRPASQPAHQGLDLHGRQQPAVQKSVDDDQLDIPAFLRRQAN
jgi:cell division protein FtsZ